jgi:hypothetical protein
MDKRPRLSVQNKTALMPNNASCKRWDIFDSIYLSLTKHALIRYWNPKIDLARCFRLLGFTIDLDRGFCTVGVDLGDTLGIP